MVLEAGGGGAGGGATGGAAAGGSGAAGGGGKTAGGGEGTSSGGGSETGDSTHSSATDGIEVIGDTGVPPIPPSTSTVGPAKNTRSNKGGKGAKGADPKGKQKKGAAAPSPLIPQVEDMLNRAELLVNLTGDRVAALAPDPAALHDDGRALERLLEEVDLFRYQDLPPDEKDSWMAEGTAMKAALMATKRVVAARLTALHSAPPPLVPSTPMGGGNKAPTASTSSVRRGRKGSRSTSVSSGGRNRLGSPGKNKSKNTPADKTSARLLNLAHTAGGGDTTAPKGFGLGRRFSASGRDSSSALTGGNRDDPGELFYLSLPRPWNVIPSKEGSKASEVHKMVTTTLPKFDGRQANYANWRSCFIPCVHEADIDVEYKCLLLRASIETSSARMREFINTVKGTSGGYKTAIETLEDRYGGAEALLLSRQESLLSIPELREGDLRVVELLHSRLTSFLDEWADMGDGIDETESLAFYTLIMSRVEASYTLRFLDWLRLQGKKKGLQSLKDWLGVQLQDHRQVEAFQRRRVVSVRTALGAEGGQNLNQVRRPSLPPSHLDRNHRSTGFLTLEDQWAAAEAEETAQVEDQVFFGRGGGNQRPPCPLCQKLHPIGHCDKFKDMSPRQRKDFLIKENRCFLCFQRSHPVTKCRFPYQCKQCGGRHHTMIHGADDDRQAHLLAAEGDEDVEGAGDLLEFGLLAGGGRGGAVSLRTLPLWVRNPHSSKMVKINALLDDGCTSAGMLSTHVAEELGLQGPANWTTTEGVGGEITTYRTFLAQVEVRPVGGSLFMKLGVQIMQQPAGSYAPIDWTKYQGEFPHLAGLPLPQPLEGEPVHLLIGSRVPNLTLALDERMGKEGDPVARKTPLGWTVTGPTRPDIPPDRSAALTALLSSTTSALPVADAEWPTKDTLCEIKNTKPVPVAQEVSDRHLSRLLERLIKEEETPAAEILSPREEYIVRQAQKTLQKCGKRYQVGCTWARGADRPPLNLPQATRRLESLESSKHFQNEDIRRAYKKVIEGWKEGGEVTSVPFPSDQVSYLLPHFPVVYLGKPSTPVRVVMDCKIELNKHLLAGPNLLNEVVGVLLRFRSGLFTFSGDIKKMFLRIYLSPIDRPYHCFLWRTPEGALEVLQFQVHVFGNAGSPFLAVWVLKEHAKKFKKTFPLAAEALQQSTLIDDVLDSLDDEGEAAATLLQVRKVLAEAGMEMAKFHSNSAQVLAGIPREDWAPRLLEVTEKCTKDTQMGLTTLGIAYDAPTDSFTFRAPVASGGPWTKRRVLKLFPRLYDPLGFLLPYTIRARVYFSSIAAKEQPWDKTLPRSGLWNTWVEELPQVCDFSLPRCTKAAVPVTSELHIFADASAQAYAAAAYSVCRYRDGSTSSRLVAARAHVAPRKQETIPRLELRAAELATCLRRTVLSHLKYLPDKIAHWSDSIIVLYWLQNYAKRFQPFVQNRLQKIRDSTSSNEWGWVPSASNPADLATRGMSPLKLQLKLQLSTLWREGPPYLQAGEYPAPPKIVPPAELRKAEQIVLLATAGEVERPLLPPERFSTLVRLYSLPLALCRWRDRARRTLHLPSLPPPWERVESHFLRLAQLEVRENLRKGLDKEARKNFHFPTLPPFLAEDWFEGEDGSHPSRLSQGTSVSPSCCQRDITSLFSSCGTPMKENKSMPGERRQP